MSPGHHLVHGTALVFMADALFPLTGIITAAYLTRNLGAEYYGYLTLAATLISWIELAISSFFARATVKLVGDAEDWRPIGATVLRLHCYVGLCAMALFWILAKPCALLLGEPRLAAYIALFSLDLLFFAPSNCHISLIIGRGKYTERAIISAGRWIARLVLILLLVGMGFSLTGAILGNIGASLIELAIARYFIRPSWPKRTIAPLALLDYAVPIFLATIILRSLGLGLFLLKMMGASAAQAGFYGAAQNVSFIMPGTIAISLSPLLLSTVNRVLREGNLPAARVLIRNAMRTVIAMFPLAAIASAASNEIAVLLFGRQFAGAGPLIAILIFAGLSLLLANLINAILISCGKPSWTLWLAAPLLPIAIAGHLFAIPRFGAVGAAAVTAAVTSLGALAGAVTVKKFFKVDLPVATFLRALLLSGIVYPAVHFWPVHGAATVAEIVIAVILVLAGYVILGEFRHGEIQFFRDVVRQALSRGLPEQSSPEDSQA